MAGKHVPMRMCVICKQRSPKKALLRYAAVPSGPIWADEKQTAPGRGVYHCNTPTCREAFVRRMAKRKSKGQGI